MNSTDTISVAPCRDSELKKLCCQYSDILPCCSAIKPKTKQFRDRSKILWGRANFTDLFEIKAELLKKGYFEFKAGSWCMFPVLKKGDILKIAVSKINDIKIGDICVYRNQDKLYSHRVVDKQVIDGKQFIIARPDGSGDIGNCTNGEKVSEQDILGKIEGIKRGRKMLLTEKRYATVWEKFLYKKAMTSLKLTDLFRKILVVILTRLQPFKLYKAFSRTLVAKMEPRLNFELAVPFSNERLNRLYIYTPLKENKKIDFPKLKKSKIFHLVMKFSNTPIGCATILNRPDSCPYKGFWINDVYIRLRYRVLDFSPILLRRAEEIVNGAS